MKTYLLVTNNQHAETYETLEEVALARWNVEHSYFNKHDNECLNFELFIVDTKTSGMEELPIPRLEFRGFK